jgi:hypothetical protein
MNNKIYLLTIVLTASSIITANAVQDPIIFPKEGQSKEQRMQDQSYCEDWAKDESGVDPSYVMAKIDSLNEQIAAEAASQSNPGMGRKILRGAALGAAMGGLDDAIDSEAGAGAAKGAVLATSKARQSQKQAEQQQAVDSLYAKKQQMEEEYQNFQRAFSACMEAKNYSVK